MFYPTFSIALMCATCVSGYLNPALCSLPDRLVYILSPEKPGDPVFLYILFLLNLFQLNSCVVVRDLLAFLESVFSSRFPPVN